ncbi:MAG: hypothetical protein VB054_04795 [Petrimonas sp.]|jgi:hypothetical protein|nr:hypothetical protein [Petrimonas sp.]
MKAKEFYDPIMVVNPYSGKLENIEPIFKLKDLFDDSYIQIALTIEDAIRMLILYDEEDNKDINCFVSKTLLYNIKDQFTRMSECEITIPKKGGKV